MKGISVNTRVSKREPGKTPLIDIIFILLIFFLVTMSTNLGTGDSGEGDGEQKSRLPLIDNPNEIHGKYLLIDVFDLAGGSDRKRDMIEDLRGSFVSLSEKLGMEADFKPVPSDGFTVSVLAGMRYSDLSAFRDLSEELAGMIRKGVPRERIIPRARELFVFYPEFLPPEPEILSEKINSGLEGQINAMSRLMGDEPNPGIHMRMPENMYMHFVKSAFRILEKKGISIDRIRIHAMKD